MPPRCIMAAGGLRSGLSARLRLFPKTLLIKDDRQNPPPLFTDDLRGVITHRPRRDLQVRVFGDRIMGLSVRRNGGLDARPVYECDSRPSYCKVKIAEVSN